MKEYIKIMLRCLKARPIAYPFYLFIAFPILVLIELPVYVLSAFFEKWNEWNDEWMYDFKKWLFNK